MSLRRSSAAAVALAVGLSLGTLTGCGGEPEPRTPDSSETPTSVTAAEALERGGLTLPADATDVVVEIVDTADVTGLVEHYRVTFTSSAESAVAVCEGHAGPIVQLSQSQTDRLGEQAVIEDGTMLCSNLNPASTGWQRDVLIQPGEPASVLVSVGLMS